MVFPICLQCGSNLHSYEPKRYGRCDSCFSKLAQCPNALDAPDGLLVRVAYFPGFAQDLTGWDTFFFDDGLVQQVIRWQSPVRSSGCPSEILTEISIDTIHLISARLAAIDFASLAAFRFSVHVDDAPSVHLFSPIHNLHVLLDQWCVDKQTLSDLNFLGASQFQAVWCLLDSLSPYTLAEHHR